MQRTHHSCYSGFALAIAVISLNVHAADWPHWRGPDYNGISTETGWNAKWPSEGPKQLWKAAIGTGFSSIAVSKAKAYTMGNKDDTDTVFCFDAETGKEVWKHSYQCPLDPKYYEGGPSVTPTIDGDSVYTISRKGHLFCLSAETGKVLWQTNVTEAFGLPLPTWGISGSAYVDKNLLILNIGSAGAAFDKKTGKLLWQSDKKAPGYSTAVPCSFDGKKLIALLASQSVIALDPETGKEAWSYPWKTSYDVNAADPIVSGNKVFISSGYDRGATVIEIKDGKAEKVWENKEMRNHFNSCVLFDGYLYGIDGEAGDKAQLKCIEFATGTVKWSQEGIGSGSVTIADKKLIVLSNKGELVVADVSPEAFKPISRAQVLTGKCWTVPTLANGRIFCRSNKGDLICLDVK